MKCRPFFFYAPLSILLACGDSSTSDVPNVGGARPDGGTAGSTSTSGSGGRGGATGSTSTSSTAGAGGTNGDAGSGGTSGASGSGGIGGAGGKGGTAGSAGNGGTGGKADAGPSGSGCGTRGLGPCRQGLTCIYPPSANCGSNDGAGTCMDTALIDCGPPPAGATVCGCDGKSYMSGCLANLAGESVKHDGACP